MTCSKQKQINTRVLQLRVFVATRTLLTASTYAEELSEDRIQLFNGEDLTRWECFLVEPEAKLRHVWSVQVGRLFCRGEPGGNLRTKKDYDNFRVVVEWRWPQEHGNSGAPIRITWKPTMLPNCVKAQLKNGNAGDMNGF